MVCILGLGDCTKTTTNNITNAVSFLSSTTVNTLVQLTHTQTSSTSATQNLDVEVGTSDAVMTGCLASYPPSECKQLFSSGLTASGITQTASIVSINTADINNKVINDLQQQLTQQIDQKMNSTTDGAADTLKTLVTSVTGIVSGKSDTTTNTTNTTSSSQFVTDNFNLKSVTQLVNDINSSQAMKVVVHNATDSGAYSLAQNVYLQATLSLLQSNSTTASVLNQMSQNSNQSQTSDEKGLADYLNAIGGWFSSLTAVPIAIGIACVVAGLIFLVMMFKGGGGGGKARRPAARGKAHLPSAPPMEYAPPPPPVQYAPPPPMEYGPPNPYFQGATNVLNAAQPFAQAFRRGR